MRNPRNDTAALGPGKNPPSRLREGSGEGLSIDGPSLGDTPSPSPSREREGNLRTCILSREGHPRDGLIRLALSPDGVILPDVRAKAPGRGAWIAVTRDELDAARVKGKLKGALARAFKLSDFAIPDDLSDRIEAELRRAALERLGLEARSGFLVTGGERIDTAARSGQLRVLYHASDASADGAGKLAQAWRVGSESEGSDLKGLALPVPRTTLSVALGRENVVHIGLTDARAAKRVGEAITRWLHFIGQRPATEPCENPGEGASASRDLRGDDQPARHEGL